MKKQIFAALAALVMAAFPALAEEAAKISLADAMKDVGTAVQNAELVKTTIAQLAPADQAAYLQELNRAAAGLGGFEVEKAARCLAINAAALVGSGARGAQLQALLVEVYKTVPADSSKSLGALLGRDVFARSEGESVSDELFVDVATNTIKAVIAATTGMEDAAERQIGSIIMFVVASKGSPENLADTLIALLPDAEVQKLAQEELGAMIFDGLASVQVSGQMSLLALLGDSQFGIPGSAPFSNTTANDLMLNLVGEDVQISRVPRTTLKWLKWYPENTRGDPVPAPEPEPYQGEK